MKEVVHLVLWVFIGALVVLVVTHASGFAQAVTAVGGQVTNDAALLAGYPPAAAGKGTQTPYGASNTPTLA